MRNVAILISSTEKAQIVAISYNRVIAPSTVEKCMADFYFRFQITWNEQMFRFMNLKLHFCCVLQSLSRCNNIKGFKVL